MTLAQAVLRASQREQGLHLPVGMFPMACTILGSELSRPSRDAGACRVSNLYGEELLRHRSPKRILGTCFPVHRWGKEQVRSAGLAGELLPGILLTQGQEEEFQLLLEKPLPDFLCDSLALLLGLLSWSAWPQPACLAPASLLSHLDLPHLSRSWDPKS